MWKTVVPKKFLCNRVWSLWTVSFGKQFRLALHCLFQCPVRPQRIGLEYREAQSKNTGWSMVLWTTRGQSRQPPTETKDQAERFEFGFYQSCRW